MNAQFAELEISLLPGAPGGCGLDFLFSLPGSDTKAHLLGPQPVTVAINPEELAGLMGSPAAYGARLAAQLFASPRAAIAFARAREAARAKSLPLRVRLRIAPGATAAAGVDGLHGLAWETITDPEDDFPLAVKEGVYFARELARQDTRPVYLTPRQELRALVMVASPADLSRLGLAPIKVPAEVERAQRSLAGVQVTALSGPGKPPATLNCLLDALRSSAAGEGPGFDILYLACHGGLTREGYFLIFEDEQGNIKKEEGEGVIQALKGLERPPRLVVLLACQGAKIRPASADLAFAARLAEAGIPAVLALQGDFTMDTAAVFMPAFFRELLRDGQIDRAAAVARGAVRDRPDFWMPALFTCLESGMIWKEAPPAANGPKYQINVQNAKGTVIGDHNTVTQTFNE